MPDHQPEDAEMSLVMPFVTCRSEGGPHDDQSYVCGYEMGKLDATLRNGIGLNYYELTIHTENVPQADLIAMEHGYAMTATQSTDVPEWTFAVFRRPEPTPTGGTGND
jgi:hypothetical protein